MIDPITASARMQAAMLESWFAIGQHMLTYWGHCIDIQQRFLHEATHHRWHVELPNGASFTDRYGRRAHDIDPERDV
ncbi:MAG: hypothetical protein M0006_14890 [Magnetospirillum sp.]|nr:hypothetical protein [Magnetospirillum sp.]